MNSPIKVQCPTCGTHTIYSNTNKYRPFCSERCKLIDLGAWADETYRIAESLTKPNSLNDEATNSDY